MKKTLEELEKEYNRSWLKYKDYLKYVELKKKEQEKNNEKD